MSTVRSLPCGSANDAATLRNYITTYALHPNQLIYNGRVFASTFSGESCQFGQGSVQSGWSTQFLQQLSGQNAVYFVPSFFVATSAFQSFTGVINGMFNVRVINCRAVYYSNTFVFPF
jgi:glucan endo-1,3-alpha-glucosidase